VKAKSNPNPQYDPELDRPIWGAREIAALINRSERQAVYLLEQGYIDADKVGGLWRSSIRRLIFGKTYASS
jgi:hypothetical protein